MNPAVNLSAGEHWQRAYEQLAEWVTLTDLEVSEDLPSTFDIFVKRLRQVLDVHAICLFLHDPQHSSQPFRPTQSVQFELYLQKPDFFPLVEAVYSWVLNRGSNVFLPSDIEPGLNDYFIPLTIFETKMGLMHVITTADPLSISRHQSLLLTLLANHVSRALHYFRMLQQEKQTYEHLLQQEKVRSLGLVLAGVIHEMNSPLTSINGYTELIQHELKQLQLPEQYQHLVEYLGVVEMESSRALDIVRSLLKFARKDTSGWSQLNLHEVLRSTLDLLQYDFKIQQIEVESLLATDSLLVSGDAVQLQQVFFNILVNASHILADLPAEQPRRLKIETYHEDGMAHVILADNGPGIPKYVLPRIFDPFFTTKEVGKGTGLGLSLCLKIINEHQGRIEAYNLPEVGAAFHIQLPALKPQRNVLEPVQPAYEAGQSGSILVIDDEVVILKLMDTILTQKGYRVVVANSGQQARQELLYQSFELIISDMHIAEWSGQALYAFMQEQGLSTQRLIYLTGAASDPLVQSFMETHQLTYLFKPFHPREILALVARVIKQGNEMPTP